MSLCKLCGRSARLVNAHIIPESMYPFENQRREPLVMVASAPETPLGKSRVGEYDPKLVCAQCESTFSPWEDYTIRLFRKESGQGDYNMIRTYDYHKLKLFFVSTLWRASETNRPFFEHVSIGPRHTARLKQMIQNHDPGEPEEYSVLIVRFTHPYDAHKAVMNPQKKRYGSDGVSFYRFYFAGHMCAIKVDRRPTPSPLSRFILRPNQPLYIASMKFEETQEYRAMVKAVRNRPLMRDNRRS